MKNLLLISLLTCSLLSVLGQNATIMPTFIQIPATSSAPGCAVAADKGKQYFNTISNKMFYCNGSAWVEYTAITPVAFMAYLTNNGNVINGTSGSLSGMTEVFDEGNDFVTGTFTVPQNGLYHFDVSIKWGTASTPNFSQATLQKCDNAGINCEIVASSKMNDQVAAQHAFGVDVKLVLGEKVRVFVTQTSGGSRVLEGKGIDDNIPTFFSGHLVR
ncbi:hypothetical protein [Runella sp.]|uniref:hypothetical protein n=1 Tax=Runella sp. TaxID=1960881 RepID=UPI003D12FA6F